MVQLRKKIGGINMKKQEYQNKNNIVKGKMIIIIMQPLQMVMLTLSMMWKV